MRSSHKKRPPEGFGERLRETFYKSGYSLTQIEKKTGINHSNFLSYIKEEMAPTVINLAIICKFFNVSADWLLFGKEVTKKCNT